MTEDVGRQQPTILRARGGYQKWSDGHSTFWGQAIQRMRHTANPLILHVWTGGDTPEPWASWHCHELAVQDFFAVATGEEAEILSGEQVAALFAAFAGLQALSIDLLARYLEDDLAGRLSLLIGEQRAQAWHSALERVAQMLQVFPPLGYPQEGVRNGGEAPQGEEEKPMADPGGRIQECLARLLHAPDHFEAATWGELLYREIKHLQAEGYQLTSKPHLIEVHEAMNEQDMYNPPNTRKK